MRSERLLELAMHRYVEALRAGTATPYECLRFFENWFHHRGDDQEELMRRAVLTLVRHDPLLLATSAHGSSVQGLSDADIQACVAAWPHDDEPLTAFLEGHLRLAMVSPRDPDHEMVARALAALQRAKPSFGGDRDFLELYADALRMAGDERYPAVLEELLELTRPEWRAHVLSTAMRHAVDTGDWAGYDALRVRWSAMPKNAHVCECAANYVANIDGLRALARGDEPGAIRCLHEAVTVSGCPHLNSGSACLLLASELLARNVATDEVRTHLQAVEQYSRTDKVVELQQRLDARG